MEQDEIIIDGPLLSRAVRRQIRLWLLLGPLVFGVLLLLALSLTSRTYTAAASVAMQQPAAPTGLQGLLGGGGSGSKHYIGILKSRAMALQVENRVHLQQIYGPKTLPTPQAAAALLMGSIKPDDDPDGLLYLNVTLPGPPRLSLHPGPRPEQIEQASAQAANAYALALKEYFVTTDTDQGNALLHGADAQVKQARTDYDDSLERVLDFNRSLGSTDPRNAPSATAAVAAPGGKGDKADDATAASGLGPLLASLFQVQADLDAAKAARRTSQERTQGQLDTLPSVPLDDPLLAESRNKVARDQAAYDEASRLYGPENPSVITARTRLGVDQEQLSRQTQGVRANLTTPDAQADAQIQSLYAKQKTLSDQIASAERHLGISRQLSGELGRLQTELSFRTEILRTALTTAQGIRMNNVSAQSRMSIVDYALPPGSGQPGASKLAILCLLPVVLAFCLAVLGDYFRSARAKAREARAALPPPSVNGANGSGTRPSVEPILEDERPRRPSGGGGE